MILATHSNVVYKIIMKSAQTRVLTVTTRYDEALLYRLATTTRHKTMQVLVSYDGVHYDQYDDTGVIHTGTESLEDLSTISDVRISAFDNLFVLSYLKKIGDSHALSVATSHDAIHWYHTGSSADITKASVIVSGHTYGGEYLMYHGDSALSVSTSKSLRKWNTLGENIHTWPDEMRIRPVSAYVTDKGILIFAVHEYHETKRLGLSAQLFALDDPTKALWDMPRELWSAPDQLRSDNTVGIGLIIDEDGALSYWQRDPGDLLVFEHSIDGLFQEEFVPTDMHIAIRKHEKNPILGPNPDNMWESDAVFNAAAVKDKGRVHLVYRAVGNSGVSMFGYASSEDGIHFDKRSRHPIYVPRMEFEGGFLSQIKNKVKGPYISGPGFGGCEDPRMTKLEGRYYLVYVAHNGYGPPRLAMSSIDENDFHNEDWNWSEPKLISRPNEVNKSGCLMPEKINGKYVVFHRVFPNILIDYLTDLDFNKPRYLEGKHKIGPRDFSWDSRKVGVGATPLKTEYGWLVIYNSVDDKEDHKYKIGAMLLDLNDPSKVLARSNMPILEPTEHYENNGLKYGVVYPCGAVIHEDDLIVYYGGSDMVVCAATYNLDSFIDRLLTHAPHKTYTPPAHRVTMSTKAV